MAMKMHEEVASRPEGQNALDPGGAELLTTFINHKDPFEPFWDFLKPHYEMVMAAEMTVGERIQCILLVKLLDEQVSARRSSHQHPKSAARRKRADRS